MYARRLKVLVGLLLGVYGCGDDLAPSLDGPGLEVPAGFPVPVVPADNRVTPAKAELGRYLFYDKRLSGNGTQACSSCHEQQRAFTDGRATAIGSTAQVHPRNSSSLINVVYNATLTWANPILVDLEQQLLVPIFGEEPIELGAVGHEEEILGRLAQDATYQELFAQAYPGQAQPVTWDNTIRALATFVRTLISGNSPFDRFVYQDDAAALSPAAKRGLDLFYSERLECNHCHGGFNFTESTLHSGTASSAARFHNTGLYNLDGGGAYPANNTGLYAVTGLRRDMGRFRPPTLRNVAVTGPYMHDGSVATLDEVIGIYQRGGRLTPSGPYAGDGRDNPIKSGFVVGFTMSDEERADLVQFLESLTDDTFLTDPRFADPFAPAPP